VLGGFADLELLLKGVAVGFAVAAPVGAIGVLCIRRTLVGGRLAGYATGLGAAAADAIYGAIGAFGVQLVGDLFMDYRHWIGAFGGLLLIGLGIMEWRAKPPEIDRVLQPSTGRLIRGVVTTFVLTLSNPVTILSFAALFAALGLGAAVDMANLLGQRTSAMIELAAGVFLGSGLWWFLLATGVNVLRHRMGAAVFRWLNRVSGMALVGFGGYALSLFFR
jgi:threonine/homoserine/homoserine lactone efflux protein